MMYRMTAVAKLVIANWKMHPRSVPEAVVLFEKIKNVALGLKGAKAVVCPPAVFLSELARELPKKQEKILLGAQDVFWEMEGAFTGEISPFQLSSVGVKYVIVGHSERRALGDNERTVAQKIAITLKSGFSGILCVGEKERDLEGEYFHFIESQLKSALTGIEKKDVKRLIVAYEPIWAISTTQSSRPATPADFLEMSLFIRKVLADMFGSALAKNTPVLYGGSVNDANAEMFLREGEADGLLVGGASLDAKKFGEILRMADSL